MGWWGIAVGSGGGTGVVGGTVGMGLGGSTGCSVVGVLATGCDGLIGVVFVCGGGIGAGVWGVVPRGVVISPGRNAVSGGSARMVALGRGSGIPPYIVPMWPCPLLNRSAAILAV